MKLVIYPGLQKTATSYFQLFCKSNYSLLKTSCKISYLMLENILTDLPKSEHFASNHNKIASYFSDYSSAFLPINKSQLKMIESAIVSELKQGYDVVLCAEDLSRQVNLDSFSAFLYRIKCTTNADIIIGMVLRDPIEWAQSMYNQFNKLRLLNFLYKDASLGVLDLSVTGLSQFLKQQSYFRLLNQKQLILQWKNNLNFAQIIPLRYSTLSKNYKMFAVEILGALLEYEQNLRSIEADLHYPGKANTNISNEWLTLIYNIFNSHQNQDVARQELQSLLKYNSEAKISMSGSYILKDIDLVDPHEFNIHPYF